MWVYMYVCMYMCPRSPRVRTHKRTCTHTWLLFICKVHFPNECIYDWAKREDYIMANWWWQAFHCLSCLVVKKQWWRWNRKKDKHLILSLFLCDFFFPSRFLIELCSVERFGAMRVTLALFRQVKNLIIWLIQLKIVFLVWNIKPQEI